MAIYSFSPFGYEGALVNVEVDIRRGVPAIDIVGLADSAVKGARETVRSAIINSGFDFPSERVLISLSPADIRKDAGFELAIALGILKPKTDHDIIVMGELELDGSIRPVRAIHAALATAFSAGICYAVVPKANYSEALESGIPHIYACDTLYDAFYGIESDMFLLNEHVSNNEIKFMKPDHHNIELTHNEMIAMLLGAGGRFNMLYIGAPGCGKTMLLQKLQYLIPSMSYDERQPTTRIHSLAGLLSPNQTMEHIPFRMPHQTATIEGICGGGINCRPGEISLAHNGVLFLDEAAEFRSSCLQMLRVPLENKCITLSRAGRSTTYPAHFQLVMATLPCPCGNYGEKDKICLCSYKSIEQYWKKFSDPLLDRIPIRLRIESSSERSVYSYEELHNIILKGSKKLGKWYADLSQEEVLNMIPATVKEWFEYHCDKNSIDTRMLFNLMREWLCLRDMLGDDSQFYREYFDDVVELCKNVY